ncbi:hypothetical protein DSO57_1031919 [Entomophthora muscae]|uniref:Uncharacterized protein n=1 Tax=Entomophthora muscae TaxID=34485 RepID=A0ACC2TMJ9_9FUNG|nr:hypothetical protein DSO57_1031919 [Entomophthora muscae]
MVCDFLASACQEVAETKGIPLVIGMQALDYFGIFNAPYLTKDSRFGPLTIEAMPFTQRLMDTVVVSFLEAKLWASAAVLMAKERRAVGSKATWHPKGAFHYGVGLANSFFGFDAAQPLPPNVKVIGPIMASKTTPLDPALQEFFEHHSRVLFVAFGSLLSLQPRETTAILKGALEAMHQGYIDGLVWGLGKTSKSNFPNKTTVNHDFMTDPRFKFLAWAPQQAILDHPNTVLFLSHGGIESIFEAIHAKTPILSLPFLGDQPRNAAKLQEMGIGIHVNPHNINLPASIATLLTRPTLQASLIKAQALIKFHPRRLQDAANYIEEHLELAHACRPHFPLTPHTPPCELSHLLPAQTRLSFIFANRIDIYLALLAFGLALLATLNPLLHFLFSHMTAITKKTKID